MRLSHVLLAAAISGVPITARAGDALDRLDDALAFASADGALRLRVSGSLALEGYAFQQPPPGLLYADGDTLVVPRLTLFADAQAGPLLYAFAQARADSGFDPGDGGPRERLDEYALRFTPDPGGAFNLQVGKFATVIGNWVPRHYAWDNPFVTAPLPYENLTGIFDSVPAATADMLLRWGGIRPVPYAVADFFHAQRVPIIWGPSYASGAAVTGLLGEFDYAFEVKNGALASRPGTWSPGGGRWDNPTLSGRIGFAPDASWKFGLSASEGTYLRAEAAPFPPSGRSLSDYRETLLAQDVSYAWHHFQFWAEAFETRFSIPGVGDAETVAYYLEAKYRFTPQFAAAVRWNQQAYGTIPDGAGGSLRWGRDLWRVDLAPSYRFTSRLQAKLQFSVTHGDSDDRSYSAFVAAQLLLRF